MKTSEFKFGIKELGYDIEKSADRLYVKSGKNIVASVGIDESGIVNTDFCKFDELKNIERVQLLNLLYRYGITTIEYREEPKKYYLKHKWIETEDCNYLNFIVKDNNYILYSQNHNKIYKTTFTQKEIDEIKKKYNTDLNDFEVIEVEE